MTVADGTVYWIALLCPVHDASCNLEQIVFPYRWTTGSTGEGPCDSAQYNCTKHSEPNEPALPTMWETGDTFMPSENSFFASSM